MRVSAFRASCEVFRNFLFTDEYYKNWRIRKMSSTHVIAINRQLAHGYSIYYFSSTSVAPYSIISSIYTNGLWSFVKLLFWAQRSEKIIRGIPRSAIHLMPKTRVGLLLAPFLTKVSLRLPCVFPSYIYSAPSSFSFILSWLIIERDRERPSLVTSST